MPDKRPHPGDHGDAVKRAKLTAAKEAAQAKALEIQRRIAASKANSNTPPTASPAVQPPASSSTSSSSALADKLAAMKARTAALLAGNKISSKIDARAAAPTDAPRPTTTLDIRRPEPKAENKPKPVAAPPLDRENIYYDPKPVPGVKTKPSRGLQFNTQGKYLEQASKLRAQTRLEQIKKALAQQTRRAGLDENSERGFLVQAPPDVEWWDEGLLEEKTYDCLGNDEKVKIDGEDSIITIYVQHPALVKAPQDKRLIVVKPMHLTPKEQAKVRRMRRAEDLKEHQAKIRLGLEPPPPPKVKRGNIIRVMGEQAIADPTAVEMFVESQIAERHDTHLKMNEDRKLTKEERLAKLEANQQKDAQKGLYMCVFKIDTLAFGRHRFQIDQNAKQLALTGITIFNPKMCLVIVEGGIHSINKYKKLMLHRIKWDENALPTEIQVEKQASDPQWMRSVDADGNLKDLSYNRCVLVFEGELKQHGFRKWGSKMCETDGEARQLLSRSKIDSMWALALARGPD